MNIPVFLDELRERGVSIFRKGNKLKYKAPEFIDAETKKLLREHKKEIMEHLAQSNEPPPTGAAWVINGDCLKAMKNMSDNSIDCIVTDPPYGLSFMGKEWDKEAPGIEIWRECFRLLKPGAFAFIMCAPRQDLLFRMIGTLSNAGFDLEFSPIHWTYASGFPKAHSLNGKLKGQAHIKQFEGAYCGFQPKPAIEYILVSMKPLSEATYTDQFQFNGKGITWLGDCQIPVKQEGDQSPTGRFPPNLLISDAVLDSNEDSFSRSFSLDAWGHQKVGHFLKVPKPSRKEKEIGLEELGWQQIRGRDPGQDSMNTPFKIRPGKRKNDHPTVKPIKLMAYLVSMGSREGDTVLDPFCGSGTACIASVLLKRKSIGIEIDAHYSNIAATRVRHYLDRLSEGDVREPEPTNINKTLQRA